MPGQRWHPPLKVEGAAFNGITTILQSCGSDG